MPYPARPDERYIAVPGGLLRTSNPALPQALHCKRHPAGNTPCPSWHAGLHGPA